MFFDSVEPSFIPPKDCLTATSNSFGNYVAIDHGDGLFTIYAHLKTITPGIDGKPIFRYTLIGDVDSTGFSCGNHLHFGLHKGDASKSALLSQSIPIVNFFVQDTSTDAPQLFNGGTSPVIQCGPDGHTYNAVSLPIQGPLEFVYVANQGSNNISAFNIDTFSGFPHEVEGSPFPIGPQPVSIAVNTAGTTMFLGLMGDPPVISYGINPSSGALNSEGTFNPGECCFPIFLAVDPTGRFLYTTFQGFGPAITSETGIDQNGVLSGNFGFSAGGGRSVLVDPLNQFLLATGVYFETGSVPSVLAFKLNPDGTFALPSAIAVGTGPLLSIASDSRGQYFYAASEGDGAIYALAIDRSTGNLSLIGSFQASVSPQCITIEPRGSFLYASSVSGRIAAFAIDSTTGSLTAIQGSPFDSGEFGSGCLSADPSGNFLYVTNSSSGNISLFAITPPSGALVFRGKFPSSGAGPSAIQAVQGHL